MINPTLSVYDNLRAALRAELEAWELDPTRFSSDYEVRLSWRIRRESLVAIGTVLSTLL